MNKKMKRIGLISLTSMSAFGVLSLTSISRVNDNNALSSLSTNNASTTVDSRVAAIPSMEYQSVFASIKTPGDSSTGGTFGCDNKHSIYLTTYNNLLAWQKDVTKHRAFQAAKKDNAHFSFDETKAAITSFKKVNKLWNGQKRDILYVSLSTFTTGSIPETSKIETTAIKDTVVLPYDAVTGEDLITVTESNGDIDWTKNLLLSKNDILVYNEHLDRFYLYRFGKLTDLIANKCESFVHYYGKGFQKVPVTQDHWNNNMNYSGTNEKNSLYAIVPTNSNYNVLMYYDNNIGVGSIIEGLAADKRPTQNNSGRIVAVVADANLNVLAKANADNAMLFPVTGVDCSTNTVVGTPDTPVPLLLEYGMKFSSSSNQYSYVGYLQSGTWNCLMIYKIDNTNGTISVANKWSLQENVGLPNNNIGFDVTYSCFDEVNKTIYFSNTWAIGNNGSDSYNGTAINAVKISDDFSTITMPVVTTGNEGLYEDYRNKLNYAVAPYYGKDTTSGVICSKSPVTKSDAGLALTTNVSYTKSNASDSYHKKDSTHRSYFTDFQDRSDAIWNTGDKTRWASSIESSEITASPSTTAGDKNLIVVNSTMPENTTFGVEQLTPNDENGTLTFNLLVTSTATDVAPPTNSKIYVSLEKFRKIGDADFYKIAEQTNSTAEEINVRRTTLEGLYNNVPSQISEETILHGFVKSGQSGPGTSPFWYSPNGSYYNDFYKLPADKQLQKLNVSKRDDLTGTLIFTIDFTDVTPKSILDQIGGARKNIQEFNFDQKFANTRDNLIKVKDTTIDFGKLLYSQITPLDVVSNYILPYVPGQANGSGKAIITNNLGPATGNDKDTWLVDLAHNNSYKWKLEKLGVNGDNSQIDVDHPLPAFNLYYQFGTETHQVTEKMVKVLSFENNNTLKYNPNNLNTTDGVHGSGNTLPNPNTSAWPVITTKTTITNVYNKYFSRQPESPMLKQPLSPETNKVALEVIGNVDNVSGFDNYGINEGITPYRLWENIKSGNINAGESINLKSYLELEPLPFDVSGLDIKYINKGEDIPNMPNGGIVVKCNNYDRLGGKLGDVIKPIVGKNGLNGYYRNNNLVDSYLDLSFKVVQNTSTNIKNSTLGLSTDPDQFYKITDKFTNQVALRNLEWGWTSGSAAKIIQENIKNVNPYFSYSVEELSRTVSSQIIGDVLTTSASGTQDISVEDIMNSSNNDIKQGLSLDKTLNEMDPAILSNDYKVNPLIVSDNLPTCIIDVVKDNANGVATLLISVPKTISSSNDASVEVTQTINITGFKKPTNWFLVAGIPSIVAAIVIATIITIIVVKKVSNKNLKKFIDNQL